MLSGGIDSPVAGMEVMRRGVTIEAIHFHSPPFTSEKAKEKVIELTRILSAHVGPIKLHIVPFTTLQKQVNKVVHERYTMTSTRRMMMRVADKLVHQIDANAIVNGENLGQVASQTLKSMYAINHVTSTPVLRPLLTLDKEEIVKRLKQLVLMTCQFNHLKIVARFSRQRILLLNLILIKLKSMKMALILNHLFKKRWMVLKH